MKGKILFEVFYINCSTILNSFDVLLVGVLGRRVILYRIRENHLNVLVGSFRK